MSTALLYVKDTRVWLRDPEYVWVPAKVLSPPVDGTLVVEREDKPGQELSVSFSDPPPLQNPDILVGQNDLTTLSYLHEPAAMNPYQQLPIYGSEIMSAYNGQEMGEMDPHLFAVAEEAYRKMSRENLNQSVIVSGESGAGKTVSAKYTMRYFATVGGASAETHVEKKVLASNPIMEAIGNAKTIRNDNSSRFGKYLEIGFSKGHQIIGAYMRTYLLEKSRVVNQSRDERNYHIFYQLCASKHVPELQGLGLDTADSFTYTISGDCTQIKDVDDNYEFTQTLEALKQLGFTPDMQHHIFVLVAAVLHLGSVKIVEVTDENGEVQAEASTVRPGDPHIDLVADMLGIDVQDLQKWLCNRRIVTDTESLVIPLNLKQAINARDGLSKHLYAMMFDWVVEQINCALKASTKHHVFIGVLDIYGFETFDVNSFEQFCINYANEKLQQQFNQHVFKLEQQEYIQEAIEWSFIDFYDNQPCIDLVESKLGIMDLLDETCKLPEASDSQLIQKLYNAHENKSSHFSKPRTSRSAFCVHHYANVVEYESEGFVEKNTDSLVNEHLKLLKASKHKLVSSMFLNQEAAVAKVTKAAATKNKRKGQGMISKPTVGLQFQESLKGLMNTLNSTSPHYIRCIKPNDEKQSFMYDPQRVVQQLRACGVLETIRISAAGYPSRWVYEDFIHRYLMLLPSGQIRRDDVRAMCISILERTIKDPEKYRFGKTKIFFRAGQVAYLEMIRSKRLHDSSVMIQKHTRGWLQMRKYRRLRLATILVQSHARGLVARRLATFLRRTKAAIRIQKTVRGFLRRSWYRKLRRGVKLVQNRCRGNGARKVYQQLVWGSKATIIQRNVRGWMARRAYRRSQRCVILVQCCARRWLARRELKRLKIEARSVAHLQKLNKGMENKVIELQQKLTDQINSSSGLADKVRHLEELLSVERTHRGEGLKRAKALEAELEEMRRVKTTIEEELNQQRQKREKDLKLHEQQLLAVNKQVSDLQDALREAEKTKEALSSLEQRYKQLGSEHSDLREHHQHVLRNLNSLEQKYADLELRQMAANQFKMADHPPPPSPAPSSVDLTASVADIRGMTPSSSPVPPEAITMVIGQHGERPHPSDMSNGIALASVVSDQADMLSFSATNGTGILLEELQKKVADYERQRALWEGGEGRRKETEGRNAHLEEELTRLRELRDAEKVALEMERDKLAGEVAGLKQSLQEGASQRLQEDVDRLTKENASLREKLAALTPATPPPETTPTVTAPTVAVPTIAPPSSQPATTKQEDVSTKETSSLQKQVSTESPRKPRPTPESSYLGILSWQDKDLHLLLNTLVLDLKLEQVEGHTPCIAAHVIFMCLRYPDHCRKEKQATEFLQGVIKGIQLVTTQHQKDLQMLAFWLANTTRLSLDLRQYGGENQHAPAKNCLTNFDLTEYHHLLNDRAIDIFNRIIKLSWERIQSLIVPCMLEYEGLPGMTSSKPVGRRKGDTKGKADAPKLTIKNLVHTLEEIIGTLEHAHVDHNLMVQFLKQLFYFINGQMLNNILLRREMCHWARGIQIGFNISQLEEWCRKRGLAESSVLAEISPVYQTCKLLQMNKTDIKEITSVCSSLNPLQIQKILTLYINDLEAPVPSSVLKEVARMGGDHTNPSQLMVNLQHLYSVTLPSTSPDVNFQEITLPPSLKANFLTKI